MGEIFIEGLGIVEIEGDSPNEVETQAILNAVSDSDDEGDPSVTRQPVNVPDPNTPDVTLNPLGGRHVPGQPGAPEQPAQEVGEGPLGLVSSINRATARKNIEELPGLLPMLAEMSPALVGSVAGGVIGSPLGPPGVVGGAAVGGLAGELFAQETGIAPTSNLNLGLAAGGPLIGGAAGQAFKVGRRGLGFLSRKAPFARAALAKNAMSGAVQEFESIGSRIIQKQTGLMTRTTKELFSAATRAKIAIAPGQLSKTRAAITELVEELSPLAPFPDVKASMKVLANIEKTILGGAATLDDIVRARSLIGGIIKKAEAAGGVRLGSAKKVFSQLVDDMDAIAASPSFTGRQARIAKAAIARAKLDFSIKDVERGVARFIKDVPDAGGKSFNVKGFQKWFRDVVNPRHKNFNKNLAESLKDDIPAIQERLVELAKLGSTGGLAGPGSIVVRGQTARMGRGAVGALFGAAAGGPIGAGVGAVAGAQLPEMIVAALTTKAGAAFLNRAAQLGKGQINARTWAALGEIIARAAGERKAPKRRRARGAVVRPIEPGPDLGIESNEDAK